MGDLSILDLVDDNAYALALVSIKRAPELVASSQICVFLEMTVDSNARNEQAKCDTASVFFFKFAVKLRIWVFQN